MNTVDGRKKTRTQVVVEVLVFAHVVDFLPLKFGHLFLHQLWRHFLVAVKCAILHKK